MGAFPTFDSAPFDSAQAASVLDWWHDAGVDLLVEDEPRDWRAAEPVPDRLATPAPAPLPAPGWSRALPAAARPRCCRYAGRLPGLAPVRRRAGGGVGRSR
jgi:DNA polymerase